MSDGTNLLPDQISYDRNEILGTGGFGTVFLGSYNGKQVAVKRIELQRLDPKDREVTLQKQLNHENVMAILAVEHDVDFRLIALELCAGTLMHVCEGKYVGPTLPSDVEVAQQIIEGLHYIHSKNLVHRDVKPENILVSKSEPATIKLSDFGFSKQTSSSGMYSISAIKGTLDWMAPEWKLNNATEIKTGSSSIDIFSTGCVIFFYVTRGTHPFGEADTVTSNIVQNNPVNIDKDAAGDCPEQFLIGIVREMIEYDPNKRPPLENVLKKLKLPFLTDSVNGAGASRTVEVNWCGTGEFQNVVRPVAEDDHCVIRFHPTQPVLACIVGEKMIVFYAANSSIPFSNWDAKPIEFPRGNIERIVTMEWNIDGIQLAAIASNERDIIVWSYPSGEILFQKNLPEQIQQIVWNPFRPNLFATFKRWWNPFREDIAEKARGVWLRNFQYSVTFCDSSPADRPTFHLCTFKRETRGVIASVQWISENRAALGLYNGGIEICEIGESTATVKVVKFVGYRNVGWIRGMLWNERTKCLATCSYRWTKVWSVDSDQPIHVYKNGFCRSFAWLPNGRKNTGDEGMNAARNSSDNFILASGMDKGRILIWTPLEREKDERILRQHSGVVDSLSFSPDGRFLASADTDGKLIIWSTENWESVFIGEKDGWIDCPSWISTFTNVPEYKLTLNSSNGTVRVVEYR